MTTPGIEVSIPHFAEPLRIERSVTDYTGGFRLEASWLPESPSVFAS